MTKAFAKKYKKEVRHYVTHYKIWERSVDNYNWVLTSTPKFTLDYRYAQADRSAEPRKGYIDGLVIEMDDGLNGRKAWKVDTKPDWLRWCDYRVKARQKTKCNNE